MSKWQFVLIFGVLIWGVTTGLLATGYDIVSGQASVLKAALNLVAYPAAGLLFGQAMWWWRRKASARSAARS